MSRPGLKCEIRKSPDKAGRYEIVITESSWRHGAHNPLLLLTVVNLRLISITTAKIASLTELTVQLPRGLLHILLPDTEPE